MTREDYTMVFEGAPALESTCHAIPQGVSKGDQSKWFSGSKWFKIDNFRYEGLAEELVSIVGSCIEDFYYVTYAACKISHGDRIVRGCFSTNFLSEDEQFITIYRILEQSNRLREFKSGESAFDKMSRVIQIVYELTGLDIKEYLWNNLLLDAITLNEDRHLNNLGIILGRDSYSIAPVFDNGLSLLCGMTSVSENPRVIMRRVKSKPFSSSFDTQIKICLQMGAPLLPIDFSRLKRLLQEYSSKIYTDTEVDTCIRVLFIQLNQLKDKVWRDISV